MRNRFVVLILAVAVSSFADAAPMVGKYVRISIPGEKKILSLAEVEVMSGGENVALAGAATQSSVGAGGVPERAVDGNSDGEYAKGSTTHTTDGGTDNPWWMVELKKPVKIDEVVVYNRKGAASRIQGAVIEVLDADKMPVICSSPFYSAEPVYRFKDGELVKTLPPEIWNLC